MLMAGYGLASLVHIEKRTHPAFRSSPQRPPQTFIEILEDMADWCYKDNRIKDEAERTTFKALIEKSAFSEAGSMLEAWQPNTAKRRKYLLQALLCDQLTLPIIEIPAHDLITQIPFSGYISTTYDVFIERAFLQKMTLNRFDYRHVGTENKNLYKQSPFPFILKLHGDVGDVSPRVTSPILNDLDFRKRLSPTDEKLKQNWRKLLVESSILFIGFERDNPGLQCIEFFFEQRLFNESKMHWIALVRYSEDPENYFESLALFKVLADKYQNLHLIQYDSDMIAFLKDVEKPLSFETQEELEKPVQLASTTPLQVFIIYDNADQKFANLLTKHLEPLKQNKQISIWNIQNLLMGKEKKSSIEKHLASAEIFLLIISPDLFANEQCAELISQAMQRYEKESEDEQPWIVPVIWREYDWQSTSIAELQPFPQNNRSLSIFEDREIDEMLADFARDLRKEITRQQTKAISETPNETAS